MSWWRVLPVVAAMALAGAMATPASAAPYGAGVAKTEALSESAATQVHYRRYQHCHRRHGRRYCHGHRRYYRSGGPGISLYFGGSRRHHGHHRRGRRHH